MVSRRLFRRLTGLSRSSLQNAPCREEPRSSAVSFSTCRYLHGRSSSMFPAFPNYNNDDDRRKWQQQRYQSYRSFHKSMPTEIAPFLPEVVIATGIIGGWVVYRTSQGKPLTPDDALECQDAYKKQEEALRCRQPKWLQERESKN